MRLSESDEQKAQYNSLLRVSVPSFKSWKFSFADEITEGKASLRSYGDKYVKSDPVIDIANSAEFSIFLIRNPQQRIDFVER